jgi:hypothetical protein
MSRYWSEPKCLDHGQKRKYDILLRGPQRRGELQGWNLSRRIDINLALGALEEAVATRDVRLELIVEQNAPFSQSQ